MPNPGEQLNLYPFPGSGPSIIVYSSIAALLAVILAGGFEIGRKAVLRTIWFCDQILGGAPHTVSLPGPPGLPLVGNLFDVCHAQCWLVLIHLTTAPVERWPRAKIGAVDKDIW
jgi:hypothetical protein